MINRIISMSMIFVLFLSFGLAYGPVMPDGGWEMQPEQKDYSEPFDAAVSDSFYSKTIREFLAGSDGENRAYSPMNVYMALAMLAETTDGQSRAQILDLLGCTDISELRKNAQALWQASFSDSETLTTKLGGSIWLDDRFDYKQETARRLSDYYFASSYKGRMGSTEYNDVLREWINSQTNDFMKNQSQGAKFSEDTLMAICTTIYFKGIWTDKFSEGLTDRMIFHGADGDKETDFMHSFSVNSLYNTDKFTAFNKSFCGNASMSFILPNEGISADDIINDNEALKFIMSSPNNYYDLENVSRRTVELNLSLPKFDIMSDISLNDGLRKLGITDIFDENKADFSPITEQDMILTDALQKARVKIDEEGCEAAAFTIFSMGCTSIMEYETVNLTLDRPFIFSLYDKSGNLIFVGVINQP